MGTSKMMQSAGGFLASAGALSIVLYFIGYNLRILMWIDAGGPAMGWAIRIGLVLIGAVVFGVGKFVIKEPTET
jgi:hypothetical protein